MIDFISKLYDHYLDYKIYYRLFHFFIIILVFILHFNFFIKLLILLILFLPLTLFNWNWKKRNVCYEVIGSPGSGKTTLVAFLSKWAIHQGYDVFTDVDILGTYPFEWLHDYGNYNMENCLIIQDEAGTTDGLDNRHYKTNFSGLDGSNRLNMLKRHRHYGQDLFFLSQGEDFEKKAKELCIEYIVLRHLNISWLLMAQFYRSEIEVDEQTQEFRLKKVKFKTRFLFTPVVWNTFDSFDKKQLPAFPKNRR